MMLLEKRCGGNGLASLQAACRCIQGSKYLRKRKVEEGRGRERKEGGGRTRDRSSICDACSSLADAERNMDAPVSKVSN